MTHSIGTHRRSNLATFALLTIVMVGFGLFADAHIQQTNVAAISATPTTSLPEQVLGDVLGYLF